MRISVICSSRQHPVFQPLQQWCERRSSGHSVQLVTRADELQGGDLLFLISCGEIIGPAIRALYKSTLVIHASDLPEGRGWSPHIWQIVNGASRIAVTLLEAEDRVDSGAIWAQEWLQFEGHELCAEINAALIRAELTLMDFAVESFGKIVPRPQDARIPTYYRKRTPEDSRIDPDRTLAEQFDLLRVADPERFPAFVDYRGQRYLLTLTKVDRPA